MRGQAEPRRDPKMHGLVMRTRLLPATAVMLVALAVPAGAIAVPSTAGAVTVSSALITKPGSLTPLKSGGSATPYGVALPSGASCPGDTAHDGYLVYSYLVPKGVLPTDVSFKTGLPSRWLGYFSSEGIYFGAVNTAEGTGQIVSVPPSFAWTRLTPHELFTQGAHTATWEGGIACATKHGVAVSYWNSQIVFTADQADPAGFTWKVVGQVSLPTSVDLGLWVGIAFLVIASAAAAYAVVLRRRSKVERASRSVGDAPGPAPDVEGVPDPEPEPAGRSQS